MQLVRLQIHILYIATAMYKNKYAHRGTNVVQNKCKQILITRV